MNTIYDGTYVIGQTSATNFIAGNGIKIDSPSAGTVRIGNDETVLWSGTLTTGNSAQLSESITGFEKYRLYGYTDDGVNYPWSVEGIVPGNFIGMGAATTNAGWCKFMYSTITNGTSLKPISGYVITWGSTTTGYLQNFKLTEIRGINRISGNA